MERENHEDTEVDLSEINYLEGESETGSGNDPDLTWYN